MAGEVVIVLDFGETEAIWAREDLVTADTEKGWMGLEKEEMGGMARLVAAVVEAWAGWGTVLQSKQTQQVS